MVQCTTTEVGWATVPTWPASQLSCHHHTVNSRTQTLTFQHVLGQSRQQQRLDWPSYVNLACGLHDFVLGSISPLFYLCISSIPFAHQLLTQKMCTFNQYKTMWEKKFSPKTKIWDHKINQLTTYTTNQTRVFNQGKTFYYIYNIRKSKFSGPVPEIYSKDVSESILSPIFFVYLETNTFWRSKLSKNVMRTAAVNAKMYQAAGPSLWFNFQ